MYSSSLKIDDYEPWRRVESSYPMIFRPCPVLEPYVSCYWLSVFTGSHEEAVRLSPKKIVLIPDGGTSIVFNINYRQNRHEEGIWGVMDHPVTLYNQHSISRGEVCTFSVDFKIGGLYLFLGMPMREFTNASPDLESVSHVLFREVAEKIINARSVGEHIRMIEDFLLKSLSNSRKYNPSVSLALDILNKSSGSIRIRELSDKLAVSERTLNRLFHEYVGIPPKTLSRIMRVQNVMKLCRDENQEDFVMAAIESGYFDQSHFIKEFKEFCGCTPGVFVKDK